MLAQRAALPQKKVKAEAQVERWSTHSAFLPLNLDLNLGLPMRRAQWKINQPPSLERE